MALTPPNAPTRMPTARKPASTNSRTEEKGTMCRKLTENELIILELRALYRPHIMTNASRLPSRPSISPSITKGRRIKELLAPTIFIIAISSLRE